MSITQIIILLKKHHSTWITEDERVEPARRCEQRVLKKEKEVDERQKYGRLAMV